MHGEEAINAPKENYNKPFRVSFYQHPYGPSYHAGDYKYYWQANIVSWFRHWILGQGCNTWRFKK